jgi:hypothetical protein
MIMISGAADTKVRLREMLKFLHLAGTMISFTQESR